MSIDQEVIPEGRVLALEILDRFREDLGVDLLPIFDDESLPTREKLVRARTALFQALAARNGFDANAALDVSIEPNVILPAERARQLSRLTGPAVYHYVSNLTSRMQQMSKASTPEDLARMILEAGLVSIGMSMAGQTFALLRAGQALLVALRGGILGIGMGAAIAAVVAVLVALVYWLTMLNPKKLLGMIINDTPSPLVVRNWRAGVDGGRGGDLFMQHGNMPSFMQDYELGDLSKKIQINPRVDLGEGEVYCAAGLFFADKNAGFYGAEGVMLLSATDGAFTLAHMFAVPYTKDNGTNVHFFDRPPGDLPRLFRDLYNGRGVRRETSMRGGYHAASTVNDPRGGVVGCIAYVGKH